MPGDAADDVKKDKGRPPGVESGPFAVRCRVVAGGGRLGLRAKTGDSDRARITSDGFADTTPGRTDRQGASAKRT